MSIGPTYAPPQFPQDGDVAYAAKFSNWAQYVNDTLAATIGPNSLAITSNLDVQGNMVVNIGGLRYSTVGDPGLALTMWTATDGNLWFRDGSNRPVQITTGGSVAAGSGSIGGEYASAGALVTYSASNLRYSFLTAATGGAYADLEGATVRVHTVGALVGTNAVVIKAPTLTGDITLTLPAQVPSGLQVMTMDATGTIGTATSPPGVLGLQVTGSVSATQTGSFGVSHVLRDTLHDNVLSVMVHAIDGRQSPPMFWNPDTGGTAGINLGTAGGGDVPAYLGFPFLKANDRIDHVDVFINKSSTVNPVRAQMWRLNMTGTIGSLVQVGADQATSNGAALYTLTFTPTGGYIVGGRDAIWVQVTGSGGTSGDNFRGAQVFFNRPTGSV